MRFFKLIATILSELLMSIWLLPRAIGGLFRAKPQDSQEDPQDDDLELERLDRIRNPSKYLDKVNATPPDA